MFIRRQLMGRIDELETINNRRKLHDFMASNAVGSYNATQAQIAISAGGGPVDPNGIAQQQSNPFEGWSELWLMYEPLELEAGIYHVTGIEGPFYNGYNDPNEVPCALVIPANPTPFDIMQLVVASPANGYPDINHVWFEYMVISTLAHTIQFSMGS